jgi:hypothetical protein
LAKKAASEPQRKTRGLELTVASQRRKQIVEATRMYRAGDADVGEAVVHRADRLFCHDPPPFANLEANIVILRRAS